MCNYRMGYGFEGEVPAAARAYNRVPRPSVVWRQWKAFPGKSRELRGR